MAKIGLNNFLIAELTNETDEGVATYGTPKKPGKAISCNVTPSNNDASLFADNILAESDKSFQKAEVTMGVDDDDNEVQSLILGHSISNGEMIRNENDNPPYVGFGRIIKKMVDGALKYKAEFVCKVKFAEPNSEANTKGESTEFGTTEYSGTASSLKNGDWSYSETFDTEAEAKTYLNSKFGVTAQQNNASSTRSSSKN